MRTILLFILFICSLAGLAQNSFDKYFTGKVLRFDFMLAGNSQKTVVYPVGMKEEPFWAGSNTNLIDPSGYCPENRHHQTTDSQNNNNYLVYS